MRNLAKYDFSNINRMTIHATNTWTHDHEKQLKYHVHTTHSTTIASVPIP